MATRLNGTVKWFNDQKGFGFIQPDGQESAKGRDVFVHVSAVEKADIDSLTEGQRVSYEIGEGKDGRSMAVNLKVEG